MGHITLLLLLFSSRVGAAEVGFDMSGWCMCFGTCYRYSSPMDVSIGRLSWTDMGSDFEIKMVSALAP